MKSTPAGNSDAARSAIFLLCWDALAMVSTAHHPFTDKLHVLGQCLMLKMMVLGLRLIFISPGGWIDVIIHSFIPWQDNLGVPCKATKGC